MPRPARLQSIVDLFSGLPEADRRGLLIDYAQQAAKWAPGAQESFAHRDVRKDAECTDEVGIFLKTSGSSGLEFRVSLGADVQTLTRALAAILCRGFQGASAPEILDTDPQFVAEIVGGNLVRLRSRTVFYMLGRMKESVQAWLAIPSGAEQRKLRP